MGAVPGLVGAVLVLAGLVAAAAPAGARYHEGIVVVWVCCLMLLLAGSGLLYGLWVIDKHEAAGWLAAAAASTAVYDMSFALRLYVEPGQPVPVALVDVMMALVWLAMVVQAMRAQCPRPPRAPVAFGALTGAAGIGAQALAFHLGPMVGPGGISPHLVEALLVAIGVATCVVLIRSDAFLTPVRVRLLTACILAAASRGLTPSVPTSPGPRAATAAMLGLIATAVFCGTAGQLLARAREQLAALARLRAAELVAHDQHEQLHEVRSGLAALAFATRLIARDDGALSDHRRQRLVGMVQGEMERLGRLVDDRDHGPDRPVRAGERITLDEAIETVVTGRRICGQRVEWHQSGLAVAVCGDAVVEALSILLVNADQHAPGAVVHVAAGVVGDQIRIVVADDGPGISPTVLPHLFTRGAHGEESAGQGLGLSLAHRLVTSLGGRLRLAETRTVVGAAFEVTLPIHDTEVVA